jgi:hypothetical protein
MLAITIEARVRSRHVAILVRVQRVRKGSPTVLHREFDYLSDKTVWIALSVALGGILLLALLLAITV